MSRHKKVQVRVANISALLKYIMVSSARMQEIAAAIQAGASAYLMALH